MASLEEMLSSRLVWASLSPHNLSAASKARSDTAAAKVSSFGFDSPAVRLRAWTLLRCLFDTAPETLDQHIQTIGTVAMSSMWTERDNAVQRSTLDAILPLLRKRSELWLIGSDQGQTAAQKEKKREANSSDEEDDDDEDEDSDEDDNDEEGSDTGSDHGDNPTNGPTIVSRPKPRAYTSFLQWLQSACGGAPHMGYSAVVVFISTIPSEILAHDDLDAASELLTDFFSALYSRPLDFDPAGCRAFFASFTECVTYLAVRMLRATCKPGSDNAASASELLHIHFGAAWSELLLPKQSLLSALGTSSSGDETGDETTRAQRIKNIGSTRVVSDLAVQVRRVASSAQNAQVLDAFLDETKADIVAVAQALPVADVASATGVRKEVLAALERATSFYAALSPTQGQFEGTALRQKSASILSAVTKIAASGLSGLAADSNLASNVKHARATLLSDLLCLLLRTAVSIPEAFDASVNQELAKATGTALPQLMGTKCVFAGVGSFRARLVPALGFGRAGTCSHLDGHAFVRGGSRRAAGPSRCIDRTLCGVRSRCQVGRVQRGIRIAAAATRTRIWNRRAGYRFGDRPLRQCRDAHRASRPHSKDRREDPHQADSYVEDACTKSMLAIICSTIEQLRNALLERANANDGRQHSQLKTALVLGDLLSCLDAWVEVQTPEGSARRLLTSPSFKGVMTAIYDLSKLYQGIDVADSAPDDWISRSQGKGIREEALCLHHNIMRGSTEDERQQMEADERAGMQDHLLDIHIPVTALVDATDSRVSLLPERQELEEMLLKACRHDAPSSLLVFDPLVPQQSSPEASSTHSNSLVDGQGLGIFARVCAAALLIVDRDRTTARRHAHLLPYVVLLSILIEDDLLLPGASKHALDSSVLPEAHRAWLQSAVTVLTAMISSLSDTVTENWHNDMVSSLQRSSIVEAEKDGIGHVLSTVWQMASGLDQPSSYLARIFHRLLNGVLSFGTVTEAGADRWLKLGEAVQDRLPAMSSAIFHAAKPIAGSSPFYDRLRNGAAAKLSGLGPTTPEERILRSLVPLSPWRLWSTRTCPLFHSRGLSSCSKICKSGIRAKKQSMRRKRRRRRVSPSSSSICCPSSKTYKAVISTLSLILSRPTSRCARCSKTRRSRSSTTICVSSTRCAIWPRATPTCASIGRTEA